MTAQPQFSPFAALTGYDSAILETSTPDRRKDHTQRRSARASRHTISAASRTSLRKPLISLPFFALTNANGGSYVSISGTVKKLDLFQRILTLEDGMQIFLDDILSIEAHTSTTL